MASRPAKVALLTVFVLSVAAIGNPTAKTTMFEGRAHVALGAAELSTDGDRLTVHPADGVPTALLAIDVRGESAFNVYFEPLEIAIGQALTTTLRGPAGAIIGRIDLVQTETQSTDVILRIEDSIRHLSDGTVRVSTHLDGKTTHEASLSAAPVMNLGTVASSTTAWAKTYHWLCVNGECSLMIDPDDTVMQFAHDPDATAPFQYLAVHLNLGDAAIAQPTQVEFGGTAVGRLVVTGEDTVPVSLN